MIFDTYWKKRYKLAEREKAKARADLACEKMLRKDQEELMDKLSDQNWSQAQAIQAYKEKLGALQKDNALHMQMLRELKREPEGAAEKTIDAKALERVVEGCTGELYDKQAAFIFLAMIDLMPGAAAKEW